MSATTLSKNTNFYVRNLQNTSDIRYRRKCSCRSWIDHWRHYTRSFRVTCSVVGCSEPATHGAHVISVDMRTDRQWWIAPFCAGCNNPKNRERMYIGRNVTLVAVHPHDYCRSAKFVPS